MATFKAVVRRPRTDGFYSVYIRVTHRRQTLFIKTDKMITKRERRVRCRSVSRGKNGTNSLVTLIFATLNSIIMLLVLIVL